MATPFLYSRTMGDHAKKTPWLGDLCECEDCLAASDDQWWQISVSLVWRVIWFAWDARAFGGEINEGMRRLIDEGWREAIWVRIARMKKASRGSQWRLEKKISRREDREGRRRVLVLKSLRLAVVWLILERKVVSKRQYR